MRLNLKNESKYCISILANIFFEKKTKNRQVFSVFPFISCDTKKKKEAKFWKLFCIGDISKIKTYAIKTILWLKAELYQAFWRILLRD